MLNAELVTVVVPTKDRHALLQRTVATLAGQQPVAPRVVVVNDDPVGDVSTTLATCRQGVEVVRNRGPHGEGGARNAGLAAVDTPWVAFCDDDDLWAPSKLSEQIATLEAKPGAEWCLAAAVGVDLGLRLKWCDRAEEAETAVAGGSFLAELLRGNIVPGGGSGVLATTTAVRQVGGFDPELPMFADWDLWIRIARRGSPVVAADALVLYAEHGGQMTRDMTNGWEALMRIRQKNDEDRRRLDIRGVDERVATWLAWRQARAGHPLRAVRSYAASTSGVEGRRGGWLHLPARRIEAAARRGRREQTGPGAQQIAEAAVEAVRPLIRNSSRADK